MNTRYCFLSLKIASHSIVGVVCLCRLIDTLRNLARAIQLEGHISNEQHRQHISQLHAIFESIFFLFSSIFNALPKKSWTFLCSVLNVWKGCLSGNEYWLNYVYYEGNIFLFKHIIKNVCVAHEMEHEFGVRIDEWRWNLRKRQFSSGKKIEWTHKKDEDTNWMWSKIRHAS